MSARAALPGDFDAIYRLGERFTAESDLPYTWDPAQATEAIWDMLQSDHAICLVYEVDEVIAGIAIGTVEKEFFKEQSAYLMKFFIEKEFRGLGVSRNLLEAFNSEAKARGASIVFSAATAGMGERVEKFYVKLFEKKGFEVLGRVMTKVL